MNRRELWQELLHLDDPQDLKFALAIVEKRLGEVSKKDGELAPIAGESEAAKEVVELDQALARQVAASLWSSLSEPRTRNFVKTMAGIEGEFGLDTIAKKLGEEKSVVKAQKFRFGRTEKKLKETFGVSVIEKRWDGSQNQYWIEELLRTAILDEIQNGHS